MANDLAFYRGDAFSFEVDLVLDDQPVEMSDYTAFFTIKKNKSHPDSRAVCRKNSGSPSSTDKGGIDIIMPTSQGKIRVVLLHEDTKDLLEGSYIYGINVVNTVDPALVYTLMQGKITVHLDVGARITGDPT